MSERIRYCIVANPASGLADRNRRRSLLESAAEVLKATIVGLETRSPSELADTARQAARQCDVLAVAGGDGTFSLVVNAVDLSSTTLAFLPFGTGNALTHALAYRGGMAAIAHRIFEGQVHHYDLIDCGRGKKAFMASLGVDGMVIRRYEQAKALGHKGFSAYLKVGSKVVLRDYHPVGGWLNLDGAVRRIRNLLSLMVVKQPYYGMGLMAVPRARWDDGRLHAQLIASGVGGALTGILTGFTIGNRAGMYHTGRTLGVWLDGPVELQIDGERGWSSDRFVFKAIPGVLRLKH